MEPADGFLERIALDEAHCVIGMAVGIGAQAVDGYDSGVLQAAGDLGLGNESLATVRVVGVLRTDLLQRHLAVQLVIERHEDSAQAAPGMGPENAEPLALAGGCADRVSRCSLGVIIIASGGTEVLAACDSRDRGLDLWLAEPGEAGAGGPARPDGGQALIDVAAVGFEVNRGQSGISSLASPPVDCRRFRPPRFLNRKYRAMSLRDELFARGETSRTKRA